MDNRKFKATTQQIKDLLGVPAGVPNSNIKGSYSTATNIQASVKPPTAKQSKPIERVQTQKIETTKVETPKIEEKVNEEITEAISEIHKAQKEFHADVSQLVQQLMKSSANITDEQRLSYQNLLDSIDNLPSVSDPRSAGNPLNDLRQVSALTDKKNVALRQILSSLTQAENLSSTEVELKKLKEDKAFAAEIRKIAPSQFAFAKKVDGMLQHLLGYELLVMTIQKKLQAAKYQVTDVATNLVLKSLEDIIPEVQRVNEHKDTFAALNRAEKVISYLLNQEGGKLAESKWQYDALLETNNMLVNVDQTLRNYKNYIISNGDDIEPLLESTLVLLEEIVRRYNENQNTWSNYLYQSISIPVSLFGGAQTKQPESIYDPLAELANVIDEIKKLKDEKVTSTIKLN